MSRIPLVYNPAAGVRPVDPEALLARLAPEYRERLQLFRLEPPFDYAPAIALAKASGGPLLVWGGAHYGSIDVIAVIDRLTRLEAKGKLSIFEL